MGPGRLQALLSDAEWGDLLRFAAANGLSLEEAASEMVSRALANRHLGRRLAPATVLQFGAMRRPERLVPPSA